MNTSDAACALRGRPDVEIVQGGDPIGLRLAPMDARTLTPTPEQAAREDPDLGVVLEPGQQAGAGLLWPGYRTLADGRTPQAVRVGLAPGDAALRAPIGVSDEPGGSPGPAPFDLQDGVPGGAELRVGPWTSRR